MTAREWFERAQKEGFAIGAFNVDNLEIFKGIVTSAKNKNSPVMVEFSPGEAGYFGLKNIVDIVINAREEYKIPILLNLDHSKTVEDCRTAINQPGFDEVHFDGSSLQLEENVKGAKEVVSAAHSKGIIVEGEMDKLGGSSEVHEEEVDEAIIRQSYTDPKRAARFVEETGIDIFAAVFGNVHGTFPTQPDLDMALLTQIKGVLPDTFISLHGGSGIPADQVKEAIKVGKIVKVNINTELRIAYKDALVEKLGENPKEYKVYSFSPEIVLAVSAVVENKIEVFGSAGKA
jgi:fructose-bisphosphate aldolase class II